MRILYYNVIKNNILLHIIYLFKTIKYTVKLLVLNIKYMIRDSYYDAFIFLVIFFVLNLRPN